MFEWNPVFELMYNIMYLCLLLYLIFVCKDLHFVSVHFFVRVFNFATINFVQRPFRSIYLHITGFAVLVLQYLSLQVCIIFENIYLVMGKDIVNFVKFSIFGVALGNIKSFFSHNYILAISINRNVSVSESLLKNGNHSKGEKLRNLSVTQLPTAVINYIRTVCN